jgi:hypothetical protein
VEARVGLIFIGYRCIDALMHPERKGACSFDAPFLLPACSETQRNASKCSENKPGTSEQVEQ